MNVFLSLAALLATAFPARMRRGKDSDEPNTFDDDAYPFTFEYSGGLERDRRRHLDQQLGNPARTPGPSGSTKPTASSCIFQLAIEVDVDDIDAAQKELDGLIAQVDPTPPGTVGDMAGLPSVTFDSAPSAPRVVLGEQARRDLRRRQGGGT